MMRKIAYGLLSLSALSFVALIGFVAFLTVYTPAGMMMQTTATAAPTEAATLPPTATATPAQASATPSPTNTLLPPPTFEPPSATPPPSETPQPTATATYIVQVDIPGLNGAESPTPSSTPGCEVNPDWGLTYEVQPNDALAAIAQRYGIYADELATGNCITDANVISVGQVIRVPGDAHPVEPAYDCSWEVLTPIQNAFGIPGEGTLTFNWIGPNAYRNMIRVTDPYGSVDEWVIDLRQNETIDLEDIPVGGRYTWYVYPLDENFVQIPCAEGGPWVFNKEAEPEPTATPTPNK